MKRIVLGVCLLALAAPLPAAAQSVEDDLDMEAKEIAIKTAVMAAPPLLRDDATVIRLDNEGEYEVLREGTNNLVCWDRSDEPGRAFSVQCTNMDNIARIQQNRAWNMSGKTQDEIAAMRAEAEENGTRELSKYGSVYYTVSGQDISQTRLHMTIAVPFATSESLGIPDNEEGGGRVPQGRRLRHGGGLLLGAHHAPGPLDSCVTGRQAESGVRGAGPCGRISPVDRAETGGRPMQRMVLVVWAPGGRPAARAGGARRRQRQLAPLPRPQPERRRGRQPGSARAVEHDGERRVGDRHSGSRLVEPGRLGPDGCS